MLFTTYGGKSCSIFYMYHKNKIYSIVFLLILKGFFQGGGYQITKFQGHVD